MFFLLIISIINLVLPGDRVTEKIDNYLKEKLSGYDKYEFEIIKSPVEEFEFSIEENNELKGGLNYLPIKLYKNNSGYIQTYLIIRLRLYKTVFVSLNEIKPKQLINPGLVKTALIEVTNLKGTPLESFDELEGMRSKNLIRTGSVLFKEFLEKEPLVKNGDWITAVAISGNVIIEIDAEVKQEGIEGEVIRIVTKDRKQFRAKIIDSSNAIILE